ncbi:predicted protein [Sclerotinia sclerotiorum 1980 UF-70]|uniref:Uncharacterized protein n=1 Tax=Sclerotinia sclerotiorum (strain ATCC 18683 / 1980 / Ss-1) TaxID=665079 RepID=A7EVY3_SCLS1|nr:predicted protein [Sclerotinia sclerotiorum 1980 UF-70]EDN93625.1 predicted protein [Sclerotinia sclerotiorum 1980 UF-70]
MDRGMCNFRAFFAGFRRRENQSANYASPAKECMIKLVWPSGRRRFCLVAFW